MTDIPMTGRVYRSMKAASDCQPELGESARTLGLREGEVAVDASGNVEPTSGGLSVAPDDPMNLPAHRRPPSWGGEGPTDEVWELDLAELESSLVYVPDPAHRLSHGTIEAASSMPSDDYAAAIAATRALWHRVEAP